MVTSEFPAQKASNAENVSIWWRRHANLGLDNICRWKKYYKLLRTPYTDTPLIFYYWGINNMIAGEMHTHIKM